MNTKEFAAIIRYVRLVNRQIELALLKQKQNPGTWSFITCARPEAHTDYFRQYFQLRGFKVRALPSKPHDVIISWIHGSLNNEQ